MVGFHLVYQASLACRQASAPMGDNNFMLLKTGPWSVPDILSVSFMAILLVAAVMEWVMWLSAFIYCLCKVFQKAETASTRVMAVLMMITFSCIRCAFIPVMLVTIPLPSRISQHFPERMVWFFQWFAFWTFSILLSVPWLLDVYTHVTHTLGRKRLANIVLDELTAPKVIVFMPCYNEALEVLLKAIDSVVESDYPRACLHIFLSFDGEQENDLYRKTLDRLNVPASIIDYKGAIDIVLKGVRITISKFAHGGKRHCQKLTFHLAQKIYKAYLENHDDLFSLFIDSDCILDKVCIQNFMYEMELKPGVKDKLLAMTGVITSTTGKISLITLLQDMEYIHGQLFERCVESACGSVTCLPGALTMIRFSALQKVSEEYFSDHVENCKDIFDFGKTHLGEDRWLTHLLMVGAQQSHQIKMCPGAFCKTEAVQTYRSLIKQRRRWFLGFITNEACMMTDFRIIKRYPALFFVRVMQNTIRTTALLFFIMVISLATTSNNISNIPVGFIAISLGMNWLLMIYFGLRLGRYKVLLYPLMFIINPIFNWAYMIYGICTAGQRTWGGPRADAATADANTTPQQAIEHAEASGNDLNIDPESFSGPSVLRRRFGTLPLQPPESINGRFTALESIAGNDHGHNDEAGFSLREWVAGDTPVDPHGSSVSGKSLRAGDEEISMPRRVDSILGLFNAGEGQSGNPEQNETRHLSQSNDIADMVSHVFDADELGTVERLDPDVTTNSDGGDSNDSPLSSNIATPTAGNDAQSPVEEAFLSSQNIDVEVPLAAPQTSRFRRWARLGFLRIASNDRMDVEAQSHGQTAIGNSLSSSTTAPGVNEATQHRGRRLLKRRPADRK